jgi:hypothetical protein
MSDAIVPGSTNAGVAIRPSTEVELQRELIVANTNDGLASARARGRVGGRRPKLTPDLHISADSMSVFNAALVPVATLLLTNLVSPAPAMAKRS